MAKKLAFDKVLFVTVVILLAFGLTMVYSASSVVAAEGGGVNPYVLKQALAVAIGLLAMWLVMHLDYRRLATKPVAYALMVFAAALLTAALFQPAINGTRRWILVAGTSVQPSELAKLVIIVYLAYQVARQEERDHLYELLVPSLLAASLLTALILLEPDLGTAGIVALAAGLMLFLAGVPWLFFVGIGAVVLPIAFLAVRLEPYRWQRVVAFLDPESYQWGAGFQADQSLIAIGSGGVFGLGLGDSVQKLHYLPYPHSDFIFSIVAEELGMIGAVGLLALFGVLIWRGVRAGLAAPDAFGRHLAWGLTAVIALQALLHVSVALSVVPTTGVPLPFLSAGGSSVVATLVACGLVLNVSQHA